MMKRFLFLPIAILLSSTFVNAQQKNNGSIILRGTGVPNKSPLYVLDGKIIDSTFNELDPNQIASFRVLKDASAVALYGKDAENGVVIMTSKKSLETVTSAPADGNRIIIRGSAAIGKTPLYVVDGDVLEEGHISGLDPNKIESLQVLKSTSAVSQYGPTAINGVIVITTKKSKPQPIKKQ